MEISTIKLGKLEESAVTKPGEHTCGSVELDVMKLLNSRMLIQGNSGAGKSWLMRLMAEQVSDKIQTIVIDTEGEFATLREKCDMALVGDGGEIKPHVQSSALLARKLLELRVSAVIDLYDLPGRDNIMTKRRHFVKLFLESLLTVPKTLWHPLIVMLDEAHKLAPQAGDSEATTAVVDFGSQGRKRAFCLIAATQRMSKLHKDVTAELNNVVIGRCWQDVDRDRAGDTLGFSKRDANVLRDLPEGRWFGFGPAFVLPGILYFQANQVKTTHPKPGERHTLSVPKPSAAILKVVGQLEELPQQAEAEARTLDEAQQTISRLEANLRDARHGVEPCTHNQDIEAMTLELAELRRVNDENAGLIEVARANQAQQRDMLGRELSALSDLTLQTYTTTSGRVGEILAGLDQGVELKAVPAPPVTPGPLSMFAPGLGSHKAETVPAFGSQKMDSNGLPEGEANVLAALIQYPHGLERNQLTVLTGYKKSTRNLYLQKLAGRGFVGTNGTKMLATPEGKQALPNARPLPRGVELQKFWLAKLDQGERNVLQVLIESQGASITREEVSERTGYLKSTRNLYLQRLASRELVLSSKEGVKASPELF